MLMTIQAHRAIDPLQHIADNSYSVPINSDLPTPPPMLPTVVGEATLTSKNYFISSSIYQADGTMYISHLIPKLAQ